MAGADEIDLCRDWERRVAARALRRRWIASRPRVVKIPFVVLRCAQDDSLDRRASLAPLVLTLPAAIEVSVTDR